eukprot:1784804-Rhodomonas_salina.2
MQYQLTSGDCPHAKPARPGTTVVWCYEQSVQYRSRDSGTDAVYGATDRVCSSNPGMLVLTRWYGVTKRRVCAGTDAEVCATNRVCSGTGGGAARELQPHPPRPGLPPFKPLCSHLPQIKPLCSHLPPFKPLCPHLPPLSPSALTARVSVADTQTNNPLQAKGVAALAAVLRPVNEARIPPFLIPPFLIPPFLIPPFLARKLPFSLLTHSFFPAHEPLSLLTKPPSLRCNPALALRSNPLCFCSQTPFSLHANPLFLVRKPPFSCSQTPRAGGGRGRGLRGGGAGLRAGI